jgi:hypothetical protein
MMPRIHQTTAARLHAAPPDTDGEQPALPARLPVDLVGASCAPPRVTVVAAAALTPIPGLDAITPDSVTLGRSADPAGTCLVDEVCQ